MLAMMRERHPDVQTAIKERSKVSCVADKGYEVDDGSRDLRPSCPLSAKSGIASRLSLRIWKRPSASIPTSSHATSGLRKR